MASLALTSAPAAMSSRAASTRLPWVAASKRGAAASVARARRWRPARKQASALPTTSPRSAAAISASILRRYRRATAIGMQVQNKKGGAKRRLSEPCQRPHIYAAAVASSSAASPAPDRSRGPWHRRRDRRIRSPRPAHCRRGGSPPSARGYSRRCGPCSAGRCTSKSFLTMATSRICAIAWRRACRSPRLPSVTSFSTIGRRSFAFGSVVDDLLVLDQRGAPCWRTSRGDARPCG